MQLLLEVSMADVKAKWNGTPYAWCMGDWTLVVDGVDVSDKIPKDLRRSPMNTYGLYDQWEFVDWLEEWTTIEDGLKETDWILDNDYWLNEITDDDNTKLEIFHAIQKQDFRHSSCGGCI